MSAKDVQNAMAKWNDATARWNWVTQSLPDALKGEAISLEEAQATLFSTYVEDFDEGQYVEDFEQEKPKEKEYKPFGSVANEVFCEQPMAAPSDTVYYIKPVYATPKKKKKGKK